jgi:2-oxoglutarate ferredoxin oxidoreductase subunit alpha
LPGNRHPNAGYFARGTGHTPKARYSEDPDNWHEALNRLKRKYEMGRKYMPRPVIEKMKGAEIGLIAFGSTAPAIEEARHQMAAMGIPTDSMRIRAVPFTDEVGEFIRAHERNYVVEMNRDGQMHQLLTLDYRQQAMQLISVAYTDGLPMTARRVRESILAKEMK